MKRPVTFLLLTLISCALWSHDMRLAHYIVHIEGEKVVCDLKLDLEDFQEVLASELTRASTQEFLRQHLSFQFDGQQVGTELVQYSTTKDWIEVRLELTTKNHQPTEIVIFNDILSEEVQGHDNLMRFIFHDRTRIFRLNKKRQQVSFSYNKC